MSFITVQLGNFSNYVGTHYWNFQDEYSTFDGGTGYSGEGSSGVDHDRTYFQSRSGAEYYPRAVVVDRVGAYGALNMQLETDGMTEEMRQLMWQGPVQTHEEPKVEKSEWTRWLQEQQAQQAKAVEKRYMNPNAPLPEVELIPPPVVKDESVRYWSDCANHNAFSINSTFELLGHHHETPTFQSFWDGYNSDNKEQWDDIYNGIRLQLEECDAFDSCQIIADSFDGFSGLAALTVKHLRDECPKGGILVAALDDGQGVVGNDKQSQQRHMCRQLNGAALLKSCVEYNVDVTMPFHVGDWTEMEVFDVRRSSMYETSAVIASCLETLTGPYRGQGKTVAGLLSHLGSRGTLCGTRFALPMRTKEKQMHNSIELAADLVGDSKGEGQSAMPKGFTELTGSRSFIDNNPIQVVATRTSAKLDSLYGSVARVVQSANIPLNATLPLPFPQKFRENPLGGFMERADKNANQACDLPAVTKCGMATWAYSGYYCQEFKPLAEWKETAKCLRKNNAFTSSLYSHFGVEQDSLKDLCEVIRNIEISDDMATESEDTGEHRGGRSGYANKYIG